MTFALHLKRTAPGLTLSLALLLAAAGPAGAASSASSASSDGASTSVGSSSTSIEKSSASSSGDDKKVAAGDYRIARIATLDTESGRLRVTLQTLDGAPAFDLLLPQEAAAQGRLAAGGVITARAREYGMEFAAAAPASPTREAFFLVLDDRWHQELRTRAVTL